MSRRHPTSPHGACPSCGVLAAGLGRGEMLPALPAATARDRAAPKWDVLTWDIRQGRWMFALGWAQWFGEDRGAGACKGPARSCRAAGM